MKFFLLILLIGFGTHGTCQNSDQIDLEPDTPEGVAIGCRVVTLDADGDGYPDESDEEPNTPKGWEVDRHGVGISAPPRICDSVTLRSPSFDPVFPIQDSLIQIAEDHDYWDWNRDFRPQNAVAFNASNFLDSEFLFFIWELAHIECYESPASFSIHIVAPDQMRAFSASSYVYRILTQYYHLTPEQFEVSKDIDGSMEIPVGYVSWD